MSGDLSVADIERIVFCLSISVSTQTFKNSQPLACSSLKTNESGHSISYKIAGEFNAQINEVEITRVDYSKSFSERDKAIFKDLKT